VNLRIFKYKSTIGQRWGVVDEVSRVVLVQNLETEDDAIEFVRDQMTAKSLNDLSE
jgi:hypothetical protein